MALLCDLTQPKVLHRAIENTYLPRFLQGLFRQS